MCRAWGSGVELKHSGYRDRFDFVTRWAAELLDLLRELREFKPIVVHFSGHGATSVSGASGLATRRDVGAPTASDDKPHGLYFHDASGQARFVRRDAIAEAFEAAGASVKLVVLSVCFTEAIASTSTSRPGSPAGAQRQSAARGDVAQHLAG